MIRVSNGDPVTLQLPSQSQISPGTITVTDNVNAANAPFTIALPSLAGATSGTAALIEAGAQIFGGNVLTLASTGDLRVEDGAMLSAKNFSALSSSITFVGAGVAPSSGMVIDVGLMAQLAQSEIRQSAKLRYHRVPGRCRLRSDRRRRPGIVTSAPALSPATADRSPFCPDGRARQRTRCCGTGPRRGRGVARRQRWRTDIRQWRQALTGFGSVSLAAAQAVIGQGTGSIDFGALGVTIQTPIVIADTSSSQTLTTKGAMLVLPRSEWRWHRMRLGGADRRLRGGSVTVAAPIQALAGNITLQASAGDVTIGNGGALIAHGVGKQFFDAVEYASGGLITLTADQGTVDIQSGAVLDFAGAALGGNGGGLTINTTNSAAPVVLSGTVLGSSASGYTGSMFSLDSAGAADLDSLAQIVTAAGITGGIGIHTGQGDLTLSQGNGLTASQVALTADGGKITVSGTIDASGAAAGTIHLFGTAGVDVEGSLIARGSQPDQLGGIVQIGTSAISIPPPSIRRRGPYPYNATYGYENVFSSGAITIGAEALIDVSGGTVGGLSGGTVLLRAPLLADGSVNITLSPTASFVGARTVSLEAYAVWSTADTTSGAQHFDGIVDPAGWYDSAGALLDGSFLDGNGIAAWRHGRAVS